MGTISSRLRQLREDAGLKKTELAKKANISHSYLSEIESGTKEPPFKTLQKICSALGVSLSEFFADENRSESNLRQAKTKRLYEVLARANELPDDDIDYIADILDILICRFKKICYKKKR